MRGLYWRGQTTNLAFCFGLDKTGGTQSGFADVPGEWPRWIHTIQHVCLFETSAASVANDASCTALSRVMRKFIFNSSQDFGPFQTISSRNDRLPRCCALVQQPGGVCLVVPVSSSSTRNDKGAFVPPHPRRENGWAVPRPAQKVFVAGHLAKAVVPHESPDGTFCRQHHEGT